MMLFFETCRWGISTIFVRTFLGDFNVPNVFSMIPNMFSIDSKQVPNYVPMCFSRSHVFVKLFSIATSHFMPFLFAHLEPI
jgi:hypothetical protein